jgi:hypothetical protein
LEVDVEDSMSQTISAHFDGEHILLDETVELEPNTRLLVTVLPKDMERKVWVAVSRKRLESAYDNGEEEYLLDLIKEPNPEYEAR